MAIKSATQKAKEFFNSGRSDIKRCRQCYKPLYANSFSLEKRKYVCPKCGWEGE